MTLFDLAIVAAFLAYVVVVGVRDRRLAAVSPEQYFLAGRSLSGWHAGISMAATQFAADTPLLVTGLVAVGGIFALWRLWIYAISFLLLAFVLAACWRRAGVLTDAELAELRYAGRGAAPLRLVKALYFGTVFNCFALAIVLLAATRIAEPFLTWNEWLPAGLFDALRRFVEWAELPLTATPADDPARWTRATSNFVSLLFITLITLFYSTLGGLRSVVKTDMVQFGIMMIASVAYAAFLVREAGGMDAMLAGLRSAFDASGRESGPSASEILAFTPSVAHDVTAMLLAVFLLQWLIQVNADGTGYLAQRTMACRDDHEAKRAATIFTFAQVLVRSLVWLPIALALLLLFPDTPARGHASYVAEREATFVLGIAEFLPAGLKGLMLTGMIAALASTVDTHLNWGASYWTNDIYRRFVCGYLGRTPGERSLVWVARISNILILLVSLLIMSRLDSVKTAWESSLLLGAGVGVMLVLRWLWWRITAWGELAALIASALLVPVVLALVPDDLAPLRILIVAAAATAAGIGASIRIHPVTPESLRAFYEKVRPPGFWGPVARAAGEDARLPLASLVRGLAATVLAALTVFCALVGIGTWMVDATPPAWLPDRDLWIGLNLAMALLALPIWIRLGFR
ncbi:MAG: sodium transporter [Betaproteobacteria bacterium]|nr:sodium transporter [Betaproteobacteria bacterium]